MKVDFFIEYEGKQTEQKLLLEIAKEVWKSEGNKVKDLLSLKLFFKPDEQKCYYVFNDDTDGSFDA